MRLGGARNAKERIKEDKFDFDSEQVILTKNYEMEPGAPESSNTAPSFCLAVEPIHYYPWRGAS